MNKVALQKLLVVGGTPTSRAELRDLAEPTGIVLKLVDGTARARQQDADAHLKWANLVAIWGPTELDHKVSGLYSGAHRWGVTKITVGRRGIESLCREILEKLPHCGS